MNNLKSQNSTAQNDRLAPGQSATVLMVSSAAPQTAPSYTQDEAVAYECACECITHLRAIYTSELSHDNPSPERRAALELEQNRLYEERRTLHVSDHAKIARIRSKYGTLIRANLAN